MIQYSLLLPEFILAGLGLLLLFLDLTSMNKRRLATVGIIGTLAALVAVLSNFGVTAVIWEQTMRADNFAQFLKIVFLIVLGTIFLFSGEYIDRRNIRTGEFYVLLVFGTLGGFVMVSSLQLLTIYVGLELLAVSSYLLAGFLKEDKRSSEAAIKFFLTGALASGVILYGFSLLYGLTGSIFLPDIQAALAATPNTAMATAAMLLVIVGFGFKIAAVPFHMWAPDAYEGAPSPISVFLITASEAAGFAVLLRILLIAFSSLSGQWQMMLAVLAFVTMTFGNITALHQTQTKRLLAYSAIAQAGYLLVGVAIATDASVQALLFYMMAYAFMTVGAFAVVIIISNQLPTEHVDDFKGLAKKSPAYAAAMTVSLLSLVGVPLTGGFMGKFLLIGAAVDGGFLWLGLALMLNSAISVPYYFRIIRNMYLAAPEEHAELQPLEPRMPVKVTLALTVVGTFALGILPNTLLRVLQNVTVF